MILRHIFILIPFAAALASPLDATTLFPETFNCPVGGETFEDYVVGSTSSWGQRPDGKAIGGVSPWPVVECPSNGLPIYKEEFSENEIAQLGELIASQAYLEMRETDSTYRRIWWLRKKLGADDYSLALDLLAASWEVDDKPELKVRYQRDFAVAADALERREDKAEDWFWITLRAANAYRELGAFEDAARLIAEVHRAEVMPSGEDAREGARFLIDGLATLIAEHNAFFEPTNLVGPDNSAVRCGDRPAEMTASEHAACDSPKYRKAMSKFEESRGESSPREAAMRADLEANLEAVGDTVKAAEAAAELADMAAEAAMEKATDE